MKEAFCWPDAHTHTQAAARKRSRNAASDSSANPGARLAGEKGAEA